ncbi:riboflavin biosynthesis protein RibF [Flavobacteriales bacterium]|nr:riboflavin biosynthesis protein RibF [Flavobacteriales bacterium]
MKIYNSLEEFKPDFNTIVTIGTFDGVHIGHKYIINHLNNIAKNEGGESVLLTFHPHPRHVLYPENQDLKLIDTLEEKKEKLAAAGLQNLIIHPFTSIFAKTKSINFVRDILVNKMRLHYLVVGHDHHFGKNREGTFNDLNSLSKTYDFTVDQIPAQSKDEIAVSSTKIRNLIVLGDIDKSNNYLGLEFGLSGTVVHGDKLGRTINYPTANLAIEKNKIVPKTGVYLVKVIFNSQELFGMLNIGVQNKKIEVHIFDFSQNIYGEKLKINFVKRMRDEQQFIDANALKAQLKIDEENCRKMF